MLGAEHIITQTVYFLPELCRGHKEGANKYWKKLEKCLVEVEGESDSLSVYSASLHAYPDPRLSKLKIHSFLGVH